MVKTCTAALLLIALVSTPAATEDDVLARVAEAADRGMHDQAVTLLSEAIAQGAAPDAYYLRGRSRFCLGQFAEALADFDKFIELRPQLASRQWERGITCFYAGEFQQGAEQFELYQTYHDNDVENSVWRFLCLVPIQGVEEARKTMLPIRNDRRVPMMQVYDLFRGEKTVEEVFEAIERDEPDADEKKGRLFYAQLYVGLYFEALGDKEQAKRYLVQAADDHRETKNINRWMWSVAEVHARRYR